MKKEFKINKFTVIASAVVFVLSVVLAVAVSNNPDALSRNWFWAFAGVNCLGFGIVFYIHGLVAQNNLCKIAGCVLFGLGILWLFTDIVFNGMNNTVGSAWWIVLLIGAVVGVDAYFVPALINKNK